MNGLKPFVQGKPPLSSRPIMIMKNKDKKASDILSKIFSKNYEREGKGVINLT